MPELTIDLGKGVKLTAPVKLHMSAEEWQRMNAYIDGLIRYENIKRENHEL